MRKFEVTLPDEIVIALEKTFPPDEVPLIINQAVLREIKKWCHLHDINYTKYVPHEGIISSVPQDEDTNSQEWTK